MPFTECVVQTLYPYFAQSLLAHFLPSTVHNGTSLDIGYHCRAVSLSRCASHGIV